MPPSNRIKIEPKLLVKVIFLVVLILAIIDLPGFYTPKTDFLSSWISTESLRTNYLSSWISNESTSSTQEFIFHPSCRCSRAGPDLSLLEKNWRYSSDLLTGDLEKVWRHISDLVTGNLEDGTYVGRSTCDQYTSALGAGQKVLSYSYYPPVTKQHHEKGFHPKETIARYIKLMKQIITEASKLYPGWRIRIYHNITNYDGVAGLKLCQLYCQYQHVDMCDMGQFPEKYPYGMFWRFQPLGDPTVRMFASRDLDSYLSLREVAAVREWMDSGKQFHVMRDGPMHAKGILGGLWGADNYRNFTFVNTVKESLWNSLLKNKVADHYGLDMEVLLHKVWPLIRENAILVHDSYHCKGDVKLYGTTRPWTTKRIGRIYVGYGPERKYALRRWMRPCPAACRPKDHQEWIWC